MRTPRKSAPQNTRQPQISRPIVSAKLSAPVTLAEQADGGLFACFNGYSVPLGKFSAATVASARQLRVGLPIGSIKSGGSAVEREIESLVRRLAAHGLLEYRIHQGDRDQVIIEPQISNYWPHQARLSGADRIVLSRFAYLRRRGNDMILESPRAGALFRICDPPVAAALALLSTPQTPNKLRRRDGFPGIELLALLLDCRILLKLASIDGDGLRAEEGDPHLVLWDFHDLLFHTHSTEGRQANPLGGLFPYAGTMPPPPAIRPSWPGARIDLRTSATTPSEVISPLAELMNRRHSVRGFDDARPITLTEVAELLDRTARVRAKWKSGIDGDDQGPIIDYTSRSYPGGGSSYELEIYLMVANCEGLARGLYHYDADRHALVAIGARAPDLDAALAAAEYAMDAPGPPQILVTIAARFNRIAWKYSSIAYSLILKDVGVLLQTMYLVATDMGLGGCAIGSNNIDLFSRMTGIEFHVEGPVGQFALGRGGRMEDDAGAP